MRRIEIKKLWTLGIVAVLWLAFCVWLFNHLGVNTSDSVDFRFYWHTPVKEIRKGDYYIIDYQGTEYQGLIVKRVACTPTDELVRDELVKMGGVARGLFTCNGHIIAHIKVTADEEGNAYPQFYPVEGIKGYFVIGDNIKSYDSRYFGLISDTAFKRAVTPIW